MCYSLPIRKRQVYEGHFRNNVNEPTTPSIVLEILEIYV